jgi:peptidoglycan/xylan/chitin deacetylase (PgdA/CDA1 family)
MSTHAAVDIARQPSAGRDPLVQLLLRFAREPRLSVLAYHRVMAQPDPMRPSEPTVAQFEARMRWLAANFEVLPLLDAVRALREGRLPPRALCVTFDDGYADNHELALPVLRRLRLPAMVFVAAGFLDGGCMFNDVVTEAVRNAAGPVLELEDLGFGRLPVTADGLRRQAIDRILRRLKYLEPERRHASALRIAERAGASVPVNLMMTPAQVRALHAGGVAVGAHTFTHPILANIPLKRARDDIVAGRERLEEIIGAPVRVFAYPNGRPGRDYRREHAELARQLGFEAAVSSAWGAARAGDDLYQIPRFTPWDRPNWRFGLRLAKSRLQNRYATA